jgi:hypothetical protein
LVCHLFETLQQVASKKGSVIFPFEEKGCVILQLLEYGSFVLLTAFPPTNLSFLL